MKYRYEDLKDDAPKDMDFQIPEALHARLSKHQELSGEAIEAVVVKALDRYLERKIEIERLFDDE